MAKIMRKAFSTPNSLILTDGMKYRSFTFIFYLHKLVNDGNYSRYISLMKSFFGYNLMGLHCESICFPVFRLILTLSFSFPK